MIQGAVEVMLTRCKRGVYGMGSTRLVVPARLRGPRRENRPIYCTPATFVRTLGTTGSLGDPRGVESGEQVGVGGGKPPQHRRDGRSAVGNALQGGARWPSEELTLAKVSRDYTSSECSKPREQFPTSSANGCSDKRIEPDTWPS
jgi:hypothetical protein